MERVSRPETQGTQRKQKANFVRGVFSSALSASPREKEIWCLIIGSKESFTSGAKIWWIVSRGIAVLSSGLMSFVPSGRGTVQPQGQRQRRERGSTGARLTTELRNWEV